MAHDALLPAQRGSLRVINSCSDSEYESLEDWQFLIVETSIRVEPSRLTQAGEKSSVKTHISYQKDQ